MAFDTYVKEKLDFLADIKSSSRYFTSLRRLKIYNFYVPSSFFILNSIKIWKFRQNAKRPSYSTCAFIHLTSFLLHFAENFLKMASNELDSFIAGLDSTGTGVESKPGTGNVRIVANPKQEPDKGQYFIDQSTGQYYYQSGDGEPMTIVQQGEDSAPATASSVTPNDNQVVLNTGGDQYQTVTIVPSDGNTGEVSVMIMQCYDNVVQWEGSVMIM